MEFLNAFTKLAHYPKRGVKMAVQVIAPLAPHLAEELWVFLGEKSSVSQVAWPKVDASLLIEEMTTYVIQVNGKVRGRYHLPRSTSREELVEKAQADPLLQHYLSAEILNTIFVPDKLLNFVTKT
jgi:leucyl-tRNA synthetase